MMTTLMTIAVTIKKLSVIKWIKMTAVIDTMMTIKKRSFIQLNVIAFWIEMAVTRQKDNED